MMWVLLEVMIRLATTVDDTVMLSKSMVAEWVQDAAGDCSGPEFQEFVHSVFTGHGGSML